LASIVRKKLVALHELLLEASDIVEDLFMVGRGHGLAPWWWWWWWWWCGGGVDLRIAHTEVER
jgi:hypothetical protein